MIVSAILSTMNSAMLPVQVVPPGVTIAAVLPAELPVQLIPTLVLLTFIIRPNLPRMIEMWIQGEIVACSRYVLW